MADLGVEYAARAAIFRRLADELKSEEDRAALLAIAENYEAESARLKDGGRARSP
jgi:acyl-CoA reductase-like NAD-dependent aldehyde dehydrogenase